MTPIDSKPQIALFDLDGTLTWRDTFGAFLLRFLGSHPARLIGLWRLPGALLSFVGNRDRGLLKSRVVRMVMAGERRQNLERFTQKFVDQLLVHGFRGEALAVLERHRAAGHRLVLLSASPNLYVPEIGRRLNFELTLCTELTYAGDVLEGHLASANRRGEEKVRCLEEIRRRIPGLPVTAYGNSGSDLPHMRRADSALLVNADSAARREASALHIPVGDWQ
jgi:phosphatidylglycerophosphatase C